MTSLKYSELTFNNNIYKVCINEHDPSGQGCINEIFINNEYVLNSFNNLKTSIIDIGANCGLATIILAKQNPESIIYSFEPHYPTFELLEENVKINNLTNVKLFNIAVSDSSDKKLQLINNPGCSGGNTTCSDVSVFSKYCNSEEISYSTVDCISLDDIISKYQIDSIELLKIDCEGAEYEIIYSSVNFKNKMVKNIVGEFHNLRYNNKADNNNNKLLEYCKQHVDGICKITMLTI
jgi:FkbM family methyltransferase